MVRLGLSGSGLVNRIDGVVADLVYCPGGDFYERQRLFDFARQDGYESK